MNMKKLIVILILLAFGQVLLGQDFQAKFIEYCGTKDTVAQRQLLEEWKQSNPDDPELITSYFNYYYLKSKQELIGLSPKQKGSESLQIKDSSNQVVGFLVDEVVFKTEHLNRAFETIDNGIARFPKRLDMRFGKIYALGKSENWEVFTTEIIMAIDYSDEIKNKWVWTNDKAVGDSVNFFLENLQGYISQLYNTGEDSLLKNMREISEEVLKYHPNHVESLSNVSISFLLIGEYDKALKSLLKAERINPEDDIVLGNIAQAYKLKEDNDNAIKYYEKVIEFGDEQIGQYAKKQIELLKQKK